MKLNPEYVLRNIAGEQVVVPTGSASQKINGLITLNTTAAFLWEKVSKLETFTVDNMVEALLAEYEVEEEIAREDSKLIVERWKEMELIEE